MLDSHEALIEVPIIEDNKTLSSTHPHAEILKHPVVEILRHPLIILLLGAFITYYVGEGIREAYQTRQAKGNFSLRVVQLAFNRLYWTRVYIERTRQHKLHTERTGLQRPKEELDYAWNKYIESAEDWNTDLISNLQLFDRYYPGENKRSRFENDVQPKFRTFHESMIALRYSDNPPNLDELSKQINDFNDELHRFTNGLEMEFIK